MVRLPDVEQRHGQSEADVAQVAAELQELGRIEAARQRSFPQAGPRHGRDQVHQEGGDHAEVVAPGQVEHPGVVLLPVTDQEADVDVPEETKHSEGRDGEVVLIATKH